MKSCILAVTVALVAAWPLSAAVPDGPTASISVDASRVLRELSPRLLGGSNVAAWTAAESFASPELRARMADLNPGVMRMPGGSWADAMYWNGNGVRGKDNVVDPTRVKDGRPDIDYSAYAPSIMVDDNGLPRTDGWHGNVDVKTLHEFIHRLPGSETMVIVNAGTGRPLDAAEWVKWANLKMGYHVKYWEIGNELEGGWEAGHVMPNGQPLTGELYAQRFKAFAKAMKAVDPTILVGGATSGDGEGGFTEALLKYDGDDVDFISAHLYPGNPRYEDKEQFGTIGTVAHSAELIHGWVRHYQPARVGKIPMLVTEWGLPAYRGNNENLCALWSTLFLRRAAISGFDGANQWLWDNFYESRRPKTKSDDAAPSGDDSYWMKSQYWSLWMWNHYTGHQLVACEQTGAPAVTSLATADADAAYVSLVNTDRDHATTVHVNLEHFAAGARGERVTFDSRSYFWNPVTGKVQWSNQPAISEIDTGPSFDVAVPAFSQVCVKVPARGHEAKVEPTVAAAPSGPAELRVVLPAEAYVGDKVEAYAQALAAGTDRPYAGDVGAAEVHVSGGAVADRDGVSLAGDVARFFVEASTPGEKTITVHSGDLRGSARVLMKPSVPKPRVVWDFEPVTLTKEGGYESDYPLTADNSVRANKRVARVDLGGVPGERKLVLRLENLPPETSLKRENIRGLFFDMMTSADFSCGDPKATISVVMQSPADYWMVLGTVPLSGAGADKRGTWATHSVAVTEAKHIAAMRYAFNVWFVIQSNEPVTGSVYLDRVGLMVR